MFLEECKHLVKEKEVTRHITEDLENSSDSDESDKQYFFFNKCSISF